MNSGRKQQDGESSNVSANGSRGTIEQTFLGVAPVSPPSSSGGIPAPAAAAPGSAAPAPPTTLTPSASTPAAAVPDSSAIVAAPMIPVAGRGAAERSAPPQAPAAPVPHPSEDGASLQRTALTADYLRDAREAALAQVQQRAQAPGQPVAGRAPAAFEATLDATPDAPPSFGTRPSLAPPLVGPPASQTGNSAAPSFGTRGFEPVPVTRAPLAESMSAALGPVADLGGGRPWSSTSNPRLPSSSSRRDAAGRWLMLAAVALATVGIVSFGGKLLSRYRAASARDRVAAAAEELPFATASAPGGDDTRAPGAASRALLANRPAPVVDGRAMVVSATGAHAGEPGAAAPGGAGVLAGVTSPESQLAATAARHVLAGNYAEALPVYQQLERSSPENTSYAAMARMLKKKVGSTTDTRTIAPATSTHR
jgi:hypothetical protein